MTAIAYPETMPAVLNLPSFEIPDDTRQYVLAICKMLADPTRLRIAYYLTNEAELNVTQLCERVAQSQPAVSHHLAMMRSSGIVDHRRAGRQIFYSLRGDAMRQTLSKLLGVDA